MKTQRQSKPRLGEPFREPPSRGRESAPSANQGNQRQLTSAATTSKAPIHGLRTKEPFHKLLTSAAQNLRVGDWEINQSDLKLAGAGRWSVRQRTLHGGRQEGVEVIEVDNGRLRFTVIPTRGMGVLSLESDDLRLGWDSPVREVVHPQFMNLPAHGGLGWLAGFNEWLVRCGLESMGAPGRDEFTTASGQKVGLDLTLHGQIANLPASEVEVVIDRTAPFRLRVRGRVDERRLFGPQLELWTEISTELGSDSLCVDDTVTNRGGSEQEFQLLYHVNYGPPLLAAGARFAAPLERVTPVNAHSAKDVKTFATYPGPIQGYSEQVYCLRPRADDHGQTLLVLHNAAGDRAASMQFALDQLPCVTLWKNTAALEDGYVTGLEPGTGFPLGRQRERAAGRVGKLAPGESRHFRITHALHAGKPVVAAALERIRQIQGSRPMRVDKVSPATF